MYVYLSISGRLLNESTEGARDCGYVVFGKYGYPHLGSIFLLMSAVLVAGESGGLVGLGFNLV
jgi:hypothetical protein